MKSKIIKAIFLILISVCSCWLIYQQVERLNGQFIVFRSLLALEAYSETKQATLDICDAIQKHSLYAICFSAFYGLVLGIGIHSIATYKKRKKDNKINSTD